MLDWKSIYEQHSSAVWKVAWRVLRDRDLAADCVQETFLSVMANSTKVPIGESGKGLLVHGIAVRRALDLLRKRCRDRRRYTSGELRVLGSTVPTPEQSAIAEELAERLRTALVELPERQAEVFCLRSFNDLSYQEIANQLGLDEPHVGVLLHRARQNLQRAAQRCTSRDLRGKISRRDFSLETNSIARWWTKRSWLILSEDVPPGPPDSIAAHQSEELAAIAGWSERASLHVEIACVGIGCFRRSRRRRFTTRDFSVLATISRWRGHREGVAKGQEYPVPPSSL